MNLPNPNPNQGENKNQNGNTPDHCRRCNKPINLTKVRCYKCMELGHIAKNYPQREAVSVLHQSQILVRDEALSIDLNPNCWIIDSREIKHVA